MKTHLLRFTALLLILSGIASSCNPDPEKEVYPKDISFTEYSLQETSCQWANLPYDEKVLVINSNEELSKYILCEEGAYYPVVDFTKQSLLLASGKTNKYIAMTAKKIQQLALDKYQLSIEISIQDVPRAERWATALLMEKLSEESMVDINVMHIPFIPAPCYCILDTLIGRVWILVEKEINEVKEMLPEDEIYPVILKFLPNNEFFGYSDSNTYEGTYSVSLENTSTNNISLTRTFATDGYWSVWAGSYLHELPSMYKIASTDTTMKLSNRNSLIFNYVSMEKFEKDYFELNEWYKSRILGL